MKFYVATNRELITTARWLMNDLRSRGHEITYDWIADVDRNGPDEHVPIEILRACAESDIRGVEECDHFVLIAPAKGGTGCWVEFGAALALIRQSAIHRITIRSVSVITPLPELRSIFQLLPHVTQYKTPEEFLCSIKS